MTPRDQLLQALPERDLQVLIIEAAHRGGWRVHHDPPSRIQREDGSIRFATATRGDPGFPDLVLARDGKVIIVEVKTLKPNWKPGQREWLKALGALVVTPLNIDRLIARLEQ